MLRGFTQPQLASAVDVALSPYQRYEQGTRSPSYDLLATICRELNVTSDYLLGLSDEAPVDER